MLDVQDCACANIRRADRVITQFYEQILAPSGLHVTQFTLLSAIEGLKTATISRLADWLKMDRTTLTRELKLLTQQGLAQVEAGTDRRTRQVILTTTGQEALERARPLWQQAQTTIINHMGEERFAALLAELFTLEALPQ
ncbi:MarR family winged helix-turn-helix transcriptional regulator [Dictyobacter kobayashii]|uniref:MarR family transcriptional regulator n=1 Tax=Dictyobacter kobayashii TaxID=2014872 RepID=A0A402AXT5_9CHLR|nr:MarR family winged helix-turn-helix transcriptional regulator [Dictyobacter kobayashii]GCE23950.1 MarR family transcriptional regulator [Dictyobacter kobayashii]